MIEYHRAGPFEGAVSFGADPGLTPIPFVTDVVSRDGVAVTLYPTRAVHTVKNVARAKTHLRNARDVVVFYVEWRVTARPPEG